MGKYVPVSAAEKYLEWGDNRPRCECHGEPMRWHKSSILRGGGQSRCAVRDREVSRFSRKRNAAAVRESHKKYRIKNKEKINSYLRDRYQRLKDQGLCCHCGKEPLLSEVSCWGCLDRQQEYNMMRVY